MNFYHVYIQSKRRGLTAVSGKSIPSVCRQESQKNRDDICLYSMNDLLQMLEEGGGDLPPCHT